MEEEIKFARNNRFVDESILDLELTNRSPISGYEDECLMSLEDTIEKVIPLVGDLSKYVVTAKRNCYRDSNILTWDESAAIYLYTMSTPLFPSLNKILRQEDRHALKPWFPFLKLFLTALDKLPSTEVTVWRAVAGDIGYSISMNNDYLYIWWSVNSSSTALNVVERFLGDNGTLFCITAMYGKKVHEYSLFPEEKEVILMPGTRLRTTTEPLIFKDLLKIVHLKEESVNNQNTHNNATYLHDYSQYLNDFEMIDTDGQSLLTPNQQQILRNQQLLRRTTKRICMTTLMSLCFPLVIFLAIYLPIYFTIIRKDYGSSHYNDTYSSLYNNYYGQSSLANKKCFHRDFNIRADILYSFDCSNATDDISRIYNGIPASSMWTSKEIGKSQSLVPEYVTPDYSNQGLAMQLRSDVKFQYIQLVKSPILFNKSLTISIWIKPNYQSSKMSYLFSQVYSISSLSISIIDNCVNVHIYGINLRSSTQLKYSVWNYVTFVFDQRSMFVSIFLDGIENAHSIIKNPIYDNSQIKQTTIGGYDAFNQYSGLIDQLSIAFLVKNQTEILDEATLVVYYNFEGHHQIDNFLFQDKSVNSNHAKGSNVSYLIGSRYSNQKTLILTNPSLSYFQSSGLISLQSSNYSYSYSLWINISTMSSFVPILHLVDKGKILRYPLSDTIDCLNMLAVNKTDENTFQLLLFTYEYGIQKMIPTSNQIHYSTWFHLTVISQLNKTEMYINGTLVGSSLIKNSYRASDYEPRLTLTIGNPEVGTNTGNLYQSICNFGQTLEQSSETILEIDNLRFYSRELKLKEIQGLANDDKQPTQYYFH